MRNLTTTEQQVIEEALAFYAAEMWEQNQDKMETAFNLQTELKCLWHRPVHCTGVTNWDGEIVHDHECGIHQ